MVDGWPMSSRFMMMAMKLLFPRDTVAGAEEVIVARPRKVAGESVLDCCYNERKKKQRNHGSNGEVHVDAEECTVGDRCLRRRKLLVKKKKLWYYS
ncbi:hypothetical protein NC653_016811 [Populus alba x Populus x berolinensis]|uniref:Uncharacterized protein n=1 Tax=Populus alba x Populus x berolinensis TaxID=444605 RepID=A0AAD6VZP5_9ROSI|nr:hypothetical protein NC653_016811 [Populus alba x Populus x berolinensis]